MRTSSIRGKAHGVLAGVAHCFPVWRTLAFALILSTSPASAAGARACDLQALRHYPMTDVLRVRAVPLSLPTVFFPAPDEKPDHDVSNGPDAPDEIKWRDALARGLKTFKPEERPILMLAAIDAWTSAKDGLVNFFVLDQGTYLEEVLVALDSEGLKQHAALFREGRALFGKDYGTSQQRYDRWSDGSGNILDPALDANLKDLSVLYAALPSLVNVAASRVAGSRELTAIFEPLRAKATDDQRLAFLFEGLLPCLSDDYAPDDEVGRLAALPPAYARIAEVYTFQAEMLNGSVDQFFYNSSGNFAPEVVTALRAMGLEKHAAAVQRGIDLFPNPYPRQTGPRREFMLAHREHFFRTMDELTNIVDDGSIQPAMINYARQADILPM
jgi:hypothetical protein